MLTPEQRNRLIALEVKTSEGDDLTEAELIEVNQLLGIEAGLQTYIVFRRGAQLIVQAETLVRAVQSAILHSGGVARDWVAHRLDTYPEHLQSRLLRESTTI